MVQRSLSIQLFAWALASSLFFSPSAPKRAYAGILDGIGLMGDSLTDEYQGTYPLTIEGLADPYPDAFFGSVDIFHAGAFNWAELLAAHRGLNFGAAGDWGEPRTRPGTTGFEYNWARSGSFISNGDSSTDENVLNQGQHTGLATQVASADVSLVYFGIGTNDFGYVHGGGITAAIVGDMIGNFQSALETVAGTAAAPNGTAVVLGTAIAGGPLGTTYNDAVKSIAVARGVPVTDLDAFYDSVIAAGALNVGGQAIALAPSPLSDPTNPLFFNLADNVHPGTVVTGLVANMFIEAVNVAYGTSLQPFSDQEILINAGIIPPTPGPTFFDVSEFVIFQPIPEPSSITLAGLGLISLIAYGRRRRRRV